MDLVIINGDVHTMDYRDTLAEAVAIRDGRIVAVGSNTDVGGVTGGRACR